MQTRLALMSLLMTFSASCKNVDCGDGTTERNGSCVPATETVSAAQCGPFTELQGSVCVPMFPPTMCDPSTTAPDTDSMGVTTCIGTGAGGCSAKLPCPAPTDGTQTICGQLYDFETNQPFAQVGASGAQCAPGAASGPCSLEISAYDAAALATSMMPPMLTTGTVYIDDCGRYKVPNIPISQITSHIVALGIDDAVGANRGPLGTTNLVGLATAAVAGATKDFDGFVVPVATSTKWSNSGGPALSSTQGIFAAVYHGHTAGADLAAGVTFAALSGSATIHAYYLSGTARATVDTGLAATAANGTALVTISGGQLTDAYYGQGGLDSSCMWEPHPALTIPLVIVVQSFRPTSAPGKTCTL